MEHLRGLAKQSFFANCVAMGSHYANILREPLWSHTDAKETNAIPSSLVHSSVDQVFSPFQAALSAGSVNLGSLPL